MLSFSKMLYCICLVMLVCQVQADAETQVNQSEKIHELSSLGNLSAQQGDIKNAVSYYRDALIVQILLGSEDAEEFMHLFNQYGEAYTRIGLFSLKDQQNKDEYLLRLLAISNLVSKNKPLAEMTHGLMLFYGQERFGASADDIHYSMLRYDPIQPECILQDLSKSDKFLCSQQIMFYQTIHKYITPELKVYRKFEIDFFNNVL